MSHQKEQVIEGRRKKIKTEKEDEERMKKIAWPHRFVCTPAVLLWPLHTWLGMARWNSQAYTFIYSLKQQLEQKVRLSSCKSQWLETPAVCVVSSRLTRVERYFQLWQYLPSTVVRARLCPVHWRGLVSSCSQTSSTFDWKFSAVSYFGLAESAV